jgi:hypothetical protein
VTSIKNKNGTLGKSGEVFWCDVLLTRAAVWKPAQPIDRPLEALNDGAELPRPVTPPSPGAKSKINLGSKYLDSDGKPIQVPETQGMKDDPVWESVRNVDSTRMDMEDYEPEMDEETDKLLIELRKNLIAEEKIASR